MIIPKFVILKGLNNIITFFFFVVPEVLLGTEIYTSLLLQVVHQIHNYNKTCKVHARGAQLSDLQHLFDSSQLTRTQTETGHKCLRLVYNNTYTRSDPGLIVHYNIKYSEYIMSLLLLYGYMSIYMIQQLRICCLEHMHITVVQNSYYSLGILKAINQHPNRTNNYFTVSIDYINTKFSQIYQYIVRRTKLI